MSQRASRFAAARCGRTTSSKLSAVAGSAARPSRRLLIERSKDLPEPLIERAVQEAEPEAAQADVGQHGIALPTVGQRRSHDERRERGRYPPDAKLAMGQPGERNGELLEPDGIVVGHEVPATGRAVLGQMNQRTGAVLHMDR